MLLDSRKMLLGFSLTGGIFVRESYYARLSRIDALEAGKSSDFITGVSL